MFSVNKPNINLKNNKEKLQLKHYWDLFIERWEQDTYTVPKGIIFKKINFFLRCPLRNRLKITMNLLDGNIKDALILELGCGTGIFSLELLNKGARHITGVDISGVAVSKANERMLRQSINASRYNFFCKDASEVDCSAYDIIVGIGLLDWMTFKDMNKLFEKVKGKKILLTFSEKRYCVYSILHRFYWLLRRIFLSVKVCPRYYSVKEIKKYLPVENARLVRSKKMSLSVIIHNL